jgi:hypothetical protein
MLLLTIVKIAHIMGLIAGLGGAVLLDFTILSHGIVRPVTAFLLHQMKILSRVVSAGLVVLWITGILLIILNWQEKADYIENPKLWAKLIIVSVLTVNGIVIHTRIMPHLQGRIGRRLFDGETNLRVGVFALIASISVVSWFAPLVLGKASELNFIVPASLILSCYVAAVLAVWGVLLVVMGSITGSAYETNRSARL